MTYRSILSLLISSAVLAACAEDGPFRAHDDDPMQGPPDAGAPDAHVPPDAPRACAVAMSLPAMTVGRPAAPFVSDFFTTAPSGPQVGDVLFSVAAALPGGTADVFDILFVEVYRQGGFPTGEPYTLDPDPTASYAAAAYIVVDYDTRTSQAAGRYWATAGTFTFSTIGLTDGSTIAATLSATTFGELDAQGRFVPGGCVATLAGGTFALRQQTAP